MRTIADRFKRRAPALALDADALARYDDIVDLSIGDTDFTTDGRIIDAAMRDAKRGYTRYGFPQGDPELIDAVCLSWKEDYGEVVRPEEVLVTGSSCLGMAQALMAILNPGEEVIVLAPYFGVYRQQIELAGGVCVEVPSYEEENYRLNAERLRAAITPKTRAIILNNPCNPTGAAYTREDLQLLCKLAQTYDLLLLAAEIYTRYVFEGEFIPLRTLPGIRERVITLNSFSKNFMMTGWRVGVTIALPEIREAIQSISGGLIYTAPSVGQRAAIEALRLREDIFRQYVLHYKERMAYAAARVADIPYMTLSRPAGTFYLFPGIKATGLSSTEFVARALEGAHVLMSPGNAFGACGEGHVRLALTRPMEELAAAFDRLQRLQFD